MAHGRYLLSQLIVPPETREAQQFMNENFPAEESAERRLPRNLDDVERMFDDGGLPTVLEGSEGQEEEAKIPLLEEILPLLDKVRVINIEIKSESIFS